MQDPKRWHIGSMGFAYDDWRGGVFYPSSIKPGEQLVFYARHQNAVEIDSTFHAAPPGERFERWAAAVPDGFRFTVKTPRAISHEALIGDAIEPMRSFVANAMAMGEKLGVVLIQYPPTLPARVWPQVARFLDALPAGVRYAVEFRHRDWFRDNVFVGLKQRGIALVNAEYDAAPRQPIATTDFAYVRLIGQHGRYEPMTHERVDLSDNLAWWRDAIEALPRVRDVYCMINNDYAGFSIATADKLRKLIGLPVTSREERLGVLF